ncbi:hypothetical protein [Dysgonomonas sp. ZJ279]|uniref:hypothetical protein n=1 Tax=Dysgonomonas sp. ZJ279 TaxID=2709796 RepID=UPI0013ECE8A0|nr:hypothetical protein [Dysgonomonas sp. ZJ279]
MFKIGSTLNFILAAGHLIALIWLMKVFEIYGLSKEINELSQIHPLLPYILTVTVSGGFFVFGLYGLSADGKIRKLPLLKVAVFAIAAIYILRAVAGVVEIIITDTPPLLESINSSGALIIGLLYLIGGLKKWVIKQVPSKLT